MMHSTKIGPLMLAAATAATLALTWTPASADVTPVAGNGTSEVLLGVELDEDSQASPQRPVQAVPCSDGMSRAGSYCCETATVTVSETGSYTFIDRFDEIDAHLQVYASPFSGVLDQSCIAACDGLGYLQLEAGRTYHLAVTSYASDTPGFSTVSIRGPGDITVGDVEEGLTLEQARALCVPGNDVPAGYMLREGAARPDTLVGTAGPDVIRGLGNNDTIRGLGGDDVLCGGDGQDTIDGGDGADFLFGQVATTSSSAAPAPTCSTGERAPTRAPTSTRGRSSGSSSRERTCDPRADTDCDRDALRLVQLDAAPLARAGGTSVVIAGRDWCDA